MEKTETGDTIQKNFYNRLNIYKISILLGVEGWYIISTNRNNPIFFFSFNTLTVIVDMVCYKKYTQ